MISFLEKLRPNQLLGDAGWLRAHLRIPLYRNAYLLILNQGLSAGLGILYWMAAARFYSTDMVGKGSAIISTLVFLSALAELSLKSGMQRFVPRAGKHVSRLVLMTYGVIFLATGLFTIGFYIIGHQFHFADPLVSGMSSNSLGLLLLAISLYTVFIVQDGVLQGLGQTLWVLLENTFYNVSKILLLVLGIAGILGNGIVTSWFLPIPFVVMMVNGLVFWRFIPRFLEWNHTPAEPVQARQIVTSVTGDHIGTILSETSIRLIPLMIVNLLGTSQNAFFYQAWLIGTMLYLVSMNVSASFTVEGALDPKRLAHYSRQTLRQILILIIPMSLLLFAAAPLILRLYGEEYSRQGSTVLRWLALAAIPYGFNAWFLSYVRVKADIRSIILAQGGQSLIMLILVYVWLPRFGISSIGLAWLIAQAAISLFVFFKTRSILLKKDQQEADGRSVNYTVTQEMGPWGGGIDLDTSVHENPQSMNGPGAVYLFLSPHLDDAVLSCGGTIYRLAKAGEKVIIATVFTADSPAGSPLSWLTWRNLRAWGLDQVEAPFSERRKEDALAALHLGVCYIHLGLLDALYRRRPDGAFYYTKKPVGVPVDQDDALITGRVIQDWLVDFARSCPAETVLRVFLPKGIGGHVDHNIVRRSAEAVFGQEALTYYEDFPYARQLGPRGESKAAFLSPGSQVWKAYQVQLTHDEIEARITASACYQSQIPGLLPTQIERSLEILSTRLPCMNGTIWNLRLRIIRKGEIRKRLAQSLNRFIQRAGGENYWYVAKIVPMNSPLEGGGFENGGPLGSNSGTREEAASRDSGQPLPEATLKPKTMALGDKGILNDGKK